jgi:hypothetical protein
MFGLLLCGLALAVQLGFGAVVRPGQGGKSPLAKVAALVVLCHARGTGPAPRDGQPIPDCILCPVSTALSALSFAAAPPPVLPGLSVRLIGAAAITPPARAPPRIAVAAAFPRGPPFTA